jgi:hypothetical protein
MKTEIPISDISPERLNRALRTSHERQFRGEDWQGAAIDGWNELGSPDGDDVFNFLSDSPDPGCDCGFCATIEWNEESQVAR